MPSDWNKNIINPTLKTNTDPTNPLTYRGISLISVPSKIYADILSNRLTSWPEASDILVEEHNGFRKDWN